MSAGMDRHGEEDGAGSLGRYGQEPLPGIMAGRSARTCRQEGIRTMAEGKALRRVVIAAGIVVVLLGLWQGWRLLRARRPLRPAVEQTRELPRPRLRPTTMPTTHPSVDRWLNDGTYVTSDGRMVETSDIDSDGLYDANEIRAYGTLRYDGHTGMSGTVPRIDGPPPAVLFAHDTDRDGLPDEWERGYFGTLDQGRLDDPDGDGYPNYMERNLRQSPIAIDLEIQGHLTGSWIDGPGGIVGTAVQPAGADGSDGSRQVSRRAGEEAVFCGGSSSREEGIGRWLRARR